MAWGADGSPGRKDIWMRVCLHPVSRPFCGLETEPNADSLDQLLRPELSLLLAATVAGKLIFNLIKR
jgi:hypothetical protein